VPEPVRRIVRAGAVVRRPAGYWTPSVHALLNHLERAGFEDAPRAIGIEGDVEIVSFIEGATPRGAADRDSLVSVAELLRRYHDTVASFRPPGWAKWQPTSIPTTGFLVCHNDLCMSNVVFRNRRAVGIIDFDFAHPADPLWDLAMAAWHWLPLSGESNVEDWPRQLRLFVDGYGVARERRREVLFILVDLVRRMRDNRAHDQRAVFDQSLRALECHWDAMLAALD
jgi:hypothetical protein